MPLLMAQESFFLPLPVAEESFFLPLLVFEEIFFLPLLVTKESFFVPLLVRGELRLLFEDERDCPLHLFSGHACRLSGWMITVCLGFGGNPFRRLGAFRAAFGDYPRKGRGVNPGV